MALQTWASTGGASTSTSAGLVAEGNTVRNYTHIFTTADAYKPYQFWNTGTTQGMTVDWVTLDEAAAKMTYYWNEDTLYPEGGDEMNTEALVNSLASGVEKGWITDEEAKAEFRAAFGTVKAADYAAKNKADAVAELEKRLAELKGSGEQSG